MIREVTACLTQGLGECLSAPGAAQSGTHRVVFVLITPFAIMFIWAAWLEFRRWWRYGPSHNRRGAFQFDRDAPGFETSQDRRDGRPLPPQPRQ